jgi:demethoxyubiquinone hydroxylase (CLK1/Coq7/Cat5 family)
MRYAPALSPALWQHLSMTESSLDPCPTLTVLYDGACPLCRREIAVYQGLQPIEPTHRLKFSDISQSDSPLPPVGVRSDYLARFHVQRSDGQVLSGAAAFVALWATLPGWRYLAMVARLPGATPLLELVYRAFLRIRPQMQGIAKAFEAPRVAHALAGDLRSDQAGETGAVWIYRGLLAVSRDAGVREFAHRHLATEKGHLDKINAVLPWPQRSRLLPGWRVAGFATGALPALFGPRAVYATIAAVETFVDQHYQHQIDKLQNQPEHANLLALLRECQQDECEHRDEAIVLQAQPPGWILRAWCGLVGRGSSAAVVLARLV